MCHLLYIQLKNLNDEAPVFEKESYKASVEEHSLPGTSVTHVRAIDMDQGELGRVLYSITGGSCVISYVKWFLIGFPDTF